MKKISRKKTFRQELEFALEEVCAELGFCSGTEEQFEKILNRTNYEADDFVNDVLEKEGLNPDLPEKHVIAQMRKNFVKRFGESVDISDIENN